MDCIDAELEEGTKNFQANDLARKTSLFDAVHLLAASWHTVNKATIRNCFRKSGLSTDNVYHDDESQSLPPKPNNLTEQKYEDWLIIDDKEECVAPSTETDICSRIMSEKVDAEETDEVDDDRADDNLLPEPPSHAKMMEAIKVLNAGCQFYGNDFNLHYSYLKCVKKKC